MAKSLGADKNTTMKVGFTVYAAIPFGFAAAVGVVRVLCDNRTRIQM